MKIAIHHSKGSYSEGWIAYCEAKGIPYKIVNAYHTDIIRHVEDCDAFMWHHHHLDPRDVLFAKQLLISLELSGKRVYPNLKSTWHFDDKLGQKYLLEAYNLPIIPTNVFYNADDARRWISLQKLPIVFKLRGGAGSYNVRLIRTYRSANIAINKMFGRGYRYFEPITLFREKLLKFKKGEATLFDVLKTLVYYFKPLNIEKSRGRERGYIYIQEFIPDCTYDIRVQFIGNKCYAMKRYVRKNDFRASGANNIDYDGSKIPVDAIKLSFEIANALKMQTLALDLIPYENSYKLAEISYAFAIDEGECDYGYWDKDLIWHEGKINPYGWMVDDLIEDQ